MRKNTRFHMGFTLIELLVVIAIIAILAALLFPAFARAREATRMTACMSQMHEIGVDVKLYREDFGKYPPILMCIPYVQHNPQFPYPSGGFALLPAENVRNRPLGLKKLNKDVNLFICPDNPVNSHTKLVTGVVYPQGVPIPSGAFYPNAPYPPNTLASANFYQFDSYDIGPQLDPGGNPVPGVSELHYALDWTGVVSASDPANQLKYPDPPHDSTVITWCNYHVAVAKGEQIPVLFLSGTVKPVAYKKFVYQNNANPNGPLNYSP